ncbi:23S rRNA (adenine(2503)-C(2))-methyltransferase RlmN [Candidatus Parcubacteria bacterium]|nr:23S rRNA (adenine(2503)-C(2))-methyltransferase RlmN [Patescibacteria group bacterium]MCG2693731.1 23S rRNA (adenine(2503)-C(2))-methyltransferase RlmN [Candidatus Parcubacteria bacterium]
MDLKKIEKILKDEPKYRLTQAMDFIFKNFGDDWEASNLSKDIKEKLSREASLKIDAEIFWADDNKSAKAIIILCDGKKIETVLMRHKDRNTICVSSQVGCPMACAFCATGKMGFERNLSAEEILEQALFFARLLKEDGERVNNIVFMGMGEPMLNFEEVMKAAKLFNEKMEIGARKISISTCGIIPGIKKLADEKRQYNLALSLHAPSDRLRGELMPINKKYRIADILDAVSDYISKTGRKVLIEYILFKGINDSKDQAKELARLLKSKLKGPFVVNLILYNKTESEFLPSEKSEVDSFKEELEENGVEATERYRFGRGIDGACGQLRKK